MKAVVIGGSGQIGGWLLRSLAGAGTEAVGTYCHGRLPGPGPARRRRPRRRGRLAPRASGPTSSSIPPGSPGSTAASATRPGPAAANLEQPLNLARAAAETGARFVYFSTDYVFDGRDGPYDEDAPPNPLSVYGQAKLEAELALAERSWASALLTVRTSWVFGPERQGKNFAYQLVKTLAAGQAADLPVGPGLEPELRPRRRRGRASGWSRQGRSGVCPRRRAPR